MKLFDLRPAIQLNNNPDGETRVRKRVDYTSEHFRKSFPFANLDEKLIKKLSANAKEYEKNFKLMWKNRHKDNSEFVKIEKRLNRKDILIRKEMGIFASGGKGTKKYKPEE